MLSTVCVFGVSMDEASSLGQAQDIPEESGRDVISHKTMLCKLSSKQY